MRKLFFDHQFRQDLDWRQKYKIRVGSLTPQNREQLANSLKDLSSESIRNRFMGSKKEFSTQELEYLTNVDGWNHFAIGVEEREDQKRGVAIARMVRSSINPEEAEIAITIIDDYQKMGLGSMLIRLIALAAAERDIHSLSFTFFPQNEGIIKLINKLGVPVKGTNAMDYVQLFIDMNDVNLDDLKSQLQQHLPMIGTFHLKT